MCHEPARLASAAVFGKARETTRPGVRVISNDVAEAAATWREYME
jgi:hypothetical protein